MRTKTRRRLVLVVVLCVVAAGFAAYLRSEHRKDDDAREAREAGLRAYAASEYGEAVQLLATFINRLDPDALALLRFSESVFALPNPDARHIEAAVTSLRRCVGLEPDNAVARRLLMQQFRRRGQLSETIAQAQWFLDRDPGDEDALLAKVATLAEMQRLDEALQTLAPHVDATSSNLALHVLHLRLMASLGMPATEVREHAQTVVRAHVEDARFGLLTAQAEMLANNAMAARSVLMGLHELAPGDKAYAQLLVPLLDAAGLPNEALEVLAGLGASALDADLRTELSRRAWQMGRPRMVIEQQERWGLAPDALPDAVMAYQVLALDELGLRDEARKAWTELARREQEGTTAAWTRLLGDVVLATGTSLRARLEACLGALERDPTVAEASWQLGRLYRAAGEAELALRAFRSAGQQAPSWRVPFVAGVRVLAETGRLPQAMHLALSDAKRAAEDPGASLLVGMLRVLARPGRSAGSPREIAEGLADVASDVSDLLPIQLALAAATGDVQRGKSLIETAVQAARAPEADVLLACALWSQAGDLGLEGACYARYESAHGVTPDLALARAVERASAEGHEAGLRMLLAAQATGDRATDPGMTAQAWAAAEARFHERMGSPDTAMAAWRRAAAGPSTDPMLYRAILDGTSIMQDDEFARSVAERLRDVTGPTCLGWQLHAARALLAEDADLAGLERAASHLKAVLAAAPEHVRARMLLAWAYEAQGDLSEALRQLALIRAGPDVGVQVDLALARLHLRLGDFGSARAILARLASLHADARTPLPVSQQLRLAAMLARLGERSQVVGLLNPLAGEDTSPEALTGQAELYAAAGELERAHEMIRPILAAREDARTLLLGAALAALQGQAAEAESLLDRAAKQVRTPAGRERMRAQHYQRIEDLPRAAASLGRLIGLEGAGEADWRELLALQVQLGRAAEISSTMASGRAARIWTPAERTWAPSEEVLMPAASRPSLRRLGGVYLLDPAQRAAAEEAIRLLAAADPDGASTGAREQIQALVTRHPRCLALHLTLAEVLLSRRQFQEAAEVCRAASVRFEAEAEPLRTLSYCYRALGRHELAAQTAGAWRRRSRGLPLEADLFLAQQSTPSAAVDLLEPYVPLAAQRGLRDLLVQFGEAELSLGNRARIEQVLEPRPEHPKGTLEAWIHLAGFLAVTGEPDVAADWLRRASAQAGAARDPGLEVELAVAWRAVAGEEGRPDALETSRGFANGVGAEASLPAGAWERLGQVRQENGDLELAEAAYRRALALDARSLVAANNLAALLIDAGHVGEGRDLAAAVVSRRPDVVEYRDTLAMALVAAGDRPAALAQYEELLRLAPQDPRWALRIVETLLEDGRSAEARERLEALAKQFPERKDGLVGEGEWARLRAAVEAASAAGE